MIVTAPGDSPAESNETFNLTGETTPEKDEAVNVVLSGTAMIISGA